MWFKPIYTEYYALDAGNWWDIYQLSPNRLILIKRDHSHQSKESNDCSAKSFKSSKNWTGDKREEKYFIFQEFDPRKFENVFREKETEAALNSSFLIESKKREKWFLDFLSTRRLANLGNGQIRSQLSLVQFIQLSCHGWWLTRSKAFLKMGQSWPLFSLFLPFHAENLSSQQDSNLDLQSRRQERWPLDHHHGPKNS